MLRGKHVVLTGGTGSFGKAFTRHVLENDQPESFTILSRDELKQFEMAQVFSPEKYPNLRYFLGDVRDRDRLVRIFDGADVIIHAAALKQVPTAEFNPTEVVRTNVMGAINVIDAAMECDVKKVVALSTDKACNPNNLYGATKLCSDKLFTAANLTTGTHPTRFSVVRYGNVVGSRGSVIPFFQKMARRGEIPITDPAMTRFFITLNQGVKLVLRALEYMEGGEIFVPKIPSMNIMTLAKAVAPDVKTKIIGIRPGEKLHEIMVSSDDSRNTVEFEHYYSILPQWTVAPKSAKKVPEGFEYASHTNDWWLDEKGLRDILEKEGVEAY